MIACKNRRLHLIQLFSVGAFRDAGRQSDHSISKLVWPFDPSDLTWICWPDPNFFANTNPYKLALHVSLIQHAAASMRLMPSIWIKTIFSKIYKTTMYLFFLFHHHRGRCFLECFLQRQCRITCVVVPSCNLSPNFYSCMLSFFLAGKTQEICRET